MVKKSTVVVIMAVVVAVGAIGALAASQPDPIRMDRMHGSISTVHASPILGDPDAPITIVEFGDYQCHQCKNWFDNTKPAISRNYIETGKASLVYVDRAFLGRDSIPAAQASYCADEQGAYWQYHDSLYRYQRDIDDGWAGKARLQAFAFDLGLDMDLFNSCLDSKKYMNRVLSNVAEGERKGVNGTPTFFIVGPDGTETKVVGAQPYVVFERILNSAL